MGKIISIVGEKGGTGKSTIAQNLAVYFKTRFDQWGHKWNVALLDTDIPQRSTQVWGEIRNANSELCHISVFEKNGNIISAIQDLSKHYEVVIVDCGGHDDTASRSGLITADLAILPVRPKNRCTRSLINMSKLIEIEKISHPINARSLLTQCPSLPSQASRILETKSVSAHFGISPLEYIIYMREIYDKADEEGKGVMECEDPKAVQEINLLGNEIASILEIEI